jgi:hypothetical protein
MVESIIGLVAVSYIVTIVIYTAINYIELRRYRHSFTVGDLIGLNSDDIYWLYIPVFNTLTLVLYGLMYLYFGVMTLIDKFINIKLK